MKITAFNFFEVNRMFLASANVNCCVTQTRGRKGKLSRGKVFKSGDVLLLLPS